MNLALNGVKYHPKEPQRLFDRLFLIRRTDQHLCALGLRFIIALALYDAVFLLDLRDIQR